MGNNVTRPLHGDCNIYVAINMGFPQVMSGNILPLLDVKEGIHKSIGILHVGRLTANIANGLTWLQQGHVFYFAA